MAHKKLIRFEAIKSFKNVLEFPQNIKGKWQEHFGNHHPITLELACGKGEYTVGLAKLFPQKNFIGVDIKGNRIYVGAKKCVEEKINNATFLRTQIDLIDMYFDTNEVEAIWITFPDPQLRTSKAKKRLTHPIFLRRYYKFLKRGGSIHLKTDSPHLYKFTLTVIKLYGLLIVNQTENLYASEITDNVLNIKTHYEQLDIAKSNRVFYLHFLLNNLPQGKDEELKQLLKNEEEID